MTNRYNAEQRLVRPSNSDAYAITPAQAQQLDRAVQAQTPVIMVDAAFAPQASTQEQATPVGRSLGLVIRLLPFSLIWLVLSLAISLWLDVGEIPGFIMFGVLTATSYYAMDKNERYDSATGVEHHRIDAAERLASQKMEYDAQLRREITQAYLKQLGGDK